MAFDADALIAGVTGDDVAAPTNLGALDQNPVDIDPNVDIDFSEVGGLQFEADSAFFDAIQRGTDNMQGSLYAAGNAIGSLTGFDGLAEFGEEGFRQNMAEAAMNPAKIESFDDIDSLASLGTYIAEAVGENVMNMALMASGGGVGVKAAQAAIGKAAIQNMNKQAAGKLLKGAFVKGSAVPAYGLGAGEVQGEFIENDINAPGTALLAGIPIAGLDVFGLERIISTAFKGMPVSNAKQLITQAAKAFGLGAATEMPTEAAQELVGIVARSIEDPEFEVFTAENMARLKEAGIKGGIAGGVFAGGGSTAVGTAKALSAKAEESRAKIKEAVKPEPAAAEGITPDTIAAAFGVDLPGDGDLKTILEEITVETGASDVFTEANEARVKAAAEAQEPTIDQIPEDAVVKTQAFVDGRAVQVEMPAREAVQLVDEEITAYYALRRCMG